MDLIWSDYIGLTGVGCILTAYALLQLDKLAADTLRYLGLNAFGAMLVLIALTITFNLASFVIEICWLTISLFGIVKVLRRRWRATGA